MKCNAASFKRVYSVFKQVLRLVCGLGLLLHAYTVFVNLSLQFERPKIIFQACNSFWNVWTDWSNSKCNQEVFLSAIPHTSLQIVTSSHISFLDFSTLKQSIHGADTFWSRLEKDQATNNSRLLWYSPEGTGWARMGFGSRLSSNGLRNGGFETNHRVYKVFYSVDWINLRMVNHHLQP